MLLIDSIHPLRVGLKAAALAASVLMAGAAHAADDATTAPTWTFGGYGTVGVVHADTSQADFTSSILKADGAGYTHRWSDTVDTRVGAQVGASLNKQWSAVLQVVSEQGLDKSFRPRVEWANVKYQVTPDLALRLGRISLPMYLAADYRKIGYAFTFVRNPIEVYNAIPISSSDGIDLTYRWHTGSIKHVGQLFYGHNDVRLIDPFRAKSRALAGFSYTAESGPLTIRVSAMTARLTVNIAEDLFDAFRQFGPAGAAIAERYAVNDKRTTGFSIGATYDPGQWYISSEAGHFDARSFFAATTAAYATAGYRWGNFTPYLSAAKIYSNDPTTSEGLPPAALPAQLRPTAGYLNAALNGLLTTIPVQSSVTAGMRWDCMTNVAVKLQYDRVRPHAGSRGTLINQQPDFRSGQVVNVASAVLDFVF